MIAFSSPVISFCVIFAICIGTQVSATPNGAPVSACSTMTPEHGVPAQTTPSPYVTIPTLMEDESVRLTLMANSSGYSTFKGYLVMAFDKSLGDAAPPIGIFSETVEGTPVLTPANYLNCLSGVKNAATHKDNSAKVIVNLLWIPPYGFVGDVVFKTTFVQNGPSFWVKTLSDIVSIPSPTTTTPSTTTRSTTTRSTTTRSTTTRSTTTPSTTTRSTTTPSTTTPSATTTSTATTTIITTTTPSGATQLDPWVGTTVLAFFAFLVSLSA